jgi:hypothetical protein
MVCESVGPVTCSACGLLFDGQAWALLVLVERMESAKVRRMLLRWPDEFCIEVRRCSRPSKVGPREFRKRVAGTLVRLKEITA